MADSANYYLLDARACLEFFAYSDTGFVLEKWSPISNYFMVCKNTISEGLVGLSGDFHRKYLVSWECLGDEMIFGSPYMILEGWGDAQSGGNAQFEGYKLAIPHDEMLKVLRNLTKMHSDLYNSENYAYTDGLENYTELFK